MLGKEALFGTDIPPVKGTKRAEKRLLEDLDEELGKGGKAAVAKTKPRLAEVGQTGVDDFGGGVTGWAETEESEESDADERPAQGFWGNR